MPALERFYLTLILLITLSFHIALANAELYVRKDKDGTLNFTTVPTEGYTKVLTEKAASQQESAGTDERVNIGGISPAESASIENACRFIKQNRGPGDYYSCLRRELAALRNSGGHPSLDSLPLNEASAIENACRFIKQNRAPRDYDLCIQRELAALRELAILEPATGTRSVEKITNESGNKVDIQTGKRNASTENVEKRSKMLEEKHAPNKPEVSSPSNLKNFSLPVKSLRAVDNPPKAKRLQSDFSPSEFIVTALIVLFLSCLVLYVRDKIYKAAHSIPCLIGRAIRTYFLPKYCRHCKARTPNLNQICDNCQVHADNEKLKAQEQERQEREARARAEEAKSREEARAREARRRAEEEEQKKRLTLEDLQRLTGYEFEALIASLFEKDGYKIVRRGGSGDEGIDLVLNFGTEKDVLQCKRWKNDIGSPVIREFYGSMIHAAARHGFIITTASFSQSAKDFCVGKPIVLIDGLYLLSWLNGTKSSRRDAGARNTSGNGFDPYQVLGLKKGASKDDIKAAYFALVKKYHPDKVSHLGHEFQKIADEKTREINRAYEILSGPGYRSSERDN